MWGVAGFACHPDSALTPRSPQSPAATRTISASAVAADLVNEPSNRYLVVFRNGGGASALRAELDKSGGLLEGLRADLGFAVVSGFSADGAARLRGASGIAAVEADIEFALEPIVEAEAVDASDVIESVFPGTSVWYWMQVINGQALSPYQMCELDPWMCA